MSKWKDHVKEYPFLTCVCWPVKRFPIKYVWCYDVKLCSFHDERSSSCCFGPNFWQMVGYSQSVEIVYNLHLHNTLEPPTVAVYICSTPQHSVLM